MMEIDPKWELEVETLLAKIQKEGPKCLRTPEEQAMAVQAWKVLSSLPPEIIRTRFSGRNMPN